MVTGEKCSNELRGFRKKSFCIEMSLGGGGVALISLTFTFYCV